MRSQTLQKSIILFSCTQRKVEVGAEGSWSVFHNLLASNLRVKCARQCARDFNTELPVAERNPCLA